MATVNEEIRDALVKRQIALIKESGKASREIMAELEGVHKDIRGRLDKRIRTILNRGTDDGPATTKRLLAIEDEIRRILKKPHRTINKQLRTILQDTANAIRSS
jgi:hypothetical protein